MKIKPEPNYKAYEIVADMNKGMFNENLHKEDIDAICYYLEGYQHYKTRFLELESQNKKLNAENQQLFERLIELEGEKK